MEDDQKFAHAPEDQASPKIIEDQGQVSAFEERPVAAALRPSKLANPAHGTNEFGASPFERPRGDGYDAALHKILIGFNEGKALRETARKIVIGGVGVEQPVSEVALALALMSAELGFRVLLVDANGDKGDLHRRLQLPNNEGLSDLLETRMAPHTFPKPTPVPNLALLSAGRSTRSLPSLLARERVFHRLQPIAGHFDYIVVNASACLPTSLARLGIGADNIILGVTEHKTSFKDVEATMGALQNELLPQPAVLVLK